ncbi:hypothetical protein M9H77_19153 [Catharanthus roseus]|uniref:Uncharacterized protein n=1 Tax=Catharanthus roseus TaxID=4058 RepID=A0ACC0B9I0_CATRO|nr:hypothetical protein M9H77_19153 [Catharanthus roseus]
MVEENGEDESIGKSADAICSRKEVVEEDVSKGPDEVNLEHEHSAINAPSKRSKIGNGQRKVPKTPHAKVKGYVANNGAFVVKRIFFRIQLALYDNRSTITAIEEIHYSWNDEQVKVIKELEFGELVNIKPFEIPKDIVSWGAELVKVCSGFYCNGVRKRNKENKASVIGCVYVLTGVHKRLDLLDQDMEELRGDLEGVWEEVKCISKSVEAANRSVMEVEDELRDNRDNIRKEEGRRQENSYMHCENEGRFCFGNSAKWNEEDDQLGGDVNDEIGVAGNKIPGWKIENEQDKETLIEEYVGSYNQYNDMKIDNDCFSDGDDKLSGGEISGEGVLTAHENDRKQAVVTEAETYKWKGRMRRMAERVPEVYVTRSNESQTKKTTQVVHRFIPIEECMTRVQQPNAHDSSGYVTCFIKNLEQSRKASPVHSNSHRNDIDIRLFLEEINLARDCILKAFGYDIGCNNPV